MTVAGQQAAGAMPDGSPAAASGGPGALVTAGVQLLQRSLALAGQYKLPTAAWHLRATFLTTAITCSPVIGPEVCVFSVWVVCG